MPLRPRTLQIMKPEKLVRLNWLHKRLHQNQILIRVVVPRKKKSPSLNRFTCFHYKQKGHPSFECSKRMNLNEGACDGPYTQDDPKDKEIEEVEEIEAEKDDETLMVLTETTPTVEKWL